MDFNENTARQMIEGSFEFENRMGLVEKLFARPEYLLLKLQISAILLTHRPIDVVLFFSEILHMLSGIANRPAEDPVHEKIGLVSGETLRNLYIQLQPDEVICAIGAMLGSMVVRYAEITGMCEEGENNGQNP